MQSSQLKSHRLYLHRTAGIDDLQTTLDFKDCFRYEVSPSDDWGQHERSHEQPRVELVI